jgi:hypothetical protein
MPYATTNQIKFTFGRPMVFGILMRIFGTTYLYWSSDLYTMILICTNSSFLMCIYICMGVTDSYVRAKSEQKCRYIRHWINKIMKYTVSQTCMIRDKQNCCESKESCLWNGLVMWLCCSSPLRNTQNLGNAHKDWGFCAYLGRPETNCDIEKSLKILEYFLEPK